jgi:hypothetical protein
MPVTHVFLVHGYSVTSLGTYAKFPALLESAGYPATNIFLSAFNSLDDAITCDDLAVALENHIAALVNPASGRLRIENTAFLCHSTGSIIARRWLLNRVKAGLPIPSHFISIAGANHGSTLAQLGETLAAKVFRDISQGTSVGSGVLTDLDYGSDFLLRLNREWLDERNKQPLAAMYQFSMGGDTIGGWEREIIWETKEPGSDSTVRISSANLNYSILEADADSGKVTPTLPNQPSPHLILEGWSHTGALGILDHVTLPTDPPFVATKAALDVNDAVGYADRLNRWTAITQDVSDRNPDNCNSTIVFHLNDRARRPINDSHIVMTDKDDSAAEVSKALVNHPIQNEAVPASVSFYVRWTPWRNGRPHTVSISARSGSNEIDYTDVSYTTDELVEGLLKPNATTYVMVTMNRDTSKTYAVYGYDSGPSDDPWGGDKQFPAGSIP